MASKAVSTSKVESFFTVTANTLPPDPSPLRGAELRSAPDSSAGFAHSLLLRTLKWRQTDGQVMTKTKDAPFLIGLQPKICASAALHVMAFGLFP